MSGKGILNAMMNSGKMRDKKYATELAKRGSTGGGLARGLCVNCDKPLIKGKCKDCNKK